MEFATKIGVGISIMHFHNHAAKPQLTSNHIYLIFSSQVCGGQLIQARLD